MHVDPVAVRVFEAFVVERCFRRHEALRQPRFFHQLDLKTGRGDDVDGEAAGFGFRDCALQNSLAGAAVKRRLDVRIFFLEGVDQGNDLLVVERAVKNDFAFGFGGVFEGRGAARVAADKTNRTNRTNMLASSIVSCAYTCPMNSSSIGSVVFIRPCSIW